MFSECCLWKGRPMFSASEGLNPVVSLMPGFRNTESRRLLLEKGINVDFCFQCRKCASGCWASDLMDLNPTQIVHAVRLGLEDLALSSKSIWLCTKCATCTARCPQGVDIAKVSFVLRSLAHRRGIPSKLPSVTAFDRAFARNMTIFGRVYEFGLINQLRMATRNFRQDSELAMPMIFKGKIKFLPSLAGFFGMRRLKSRAKACGKAGERQAKEGLDS